MHYLQARHVKGPSRFSPSHAGNALARKPDKKQIIMSPPASFHHTSLRVNDPCFLLRRFAPAGLLPMRSFVVFAVERIVLRARKSQAVPRVRSAIYARHQGRRRRGIALMQGRRLRTCPADAEEGEVRRRDAEGAGGKQHMMRCWHAPSLCRKP